MINLTLHNIFRGVQEPFQEASSSSAMDSMHLEAHLSCQCGVSLNGEFVLPNSPYRDTSLVQPIWLKHKD